MNFCYSDTIVDVKGCGLDSRGIVGPFYAGTSDFSISTASRSASCPPSLLFSQAHHSHRGPRLSMSGATTLPLGTSPCRAFFECVLKLTLEEAMKALDGGGWSVPRPGLCTVRKGTRYPRYRRPGEPRGRSALVRKISAPHAFDIRTSQAVPIMLSSPPFFFFF